MGKINLAAPKQKSTCSTSLVSLRSHIIYSGLNLLLWSIGERGDNAEELIITLK